ncbi:MAG: hypothetical protein IMX05_06595 [Hydrogenibacillus schlegelii]|nr:hypothetical protein [Hydrogenibacillus schlegelii]
MAALFVAMGGVFSLPMAEGKAALPPGKIIAAPDEAALAPKSSALASFVPELSFSGPEVAERTVSLRLYASEKAALWLDVPADWRPLGAWTAPEGEVRGTAAFWAPSGPVPSAADGGVRWLFQLLVTDDLQGRLEAAMEASPGAYAVSLRPTAVAGRPGWSLEYRLRGVGLRDVAALERWVVLRPEERVRLGLPPAAVVRLAAFRAVPPGGAPAGNPAGEASVEPDVFRRLVERLRVR